MALSLAAVAGVACGSGRGPSATPPETISRAWEATAPQIDVRAPDPMLVPSPVPDTTVTLVEAPSGDPLAAALEVDQSAQTIWAERAPGDPLRGRMLLVGRTTLSDTDGAFALEGRPLELTGAKGAVVGRRGPLRLVTWPLPVSDCACDQAAVVAGRNLTEAEVVAAARGARPLQPRPSIAPGALPDGLLSLGTLPALGLGDRWYGIAETIHVLIGPTVVELRIVDGDERLPLHLRFWIDDEATLEYEGSDHLNAVRSVGRHMVLTRARGTGVEAKRLDDVVGALHEAGAGEAAAAERRATERPVDAGDRCDLGSAGPVPDEATFAGAVDGQRWTITLGTRDGRYFESCHGGSAGAGGGGGGPLPPPAAPDEVRFLGGMSTNGPGGRWLHVTAGDVPAGAAKVFVNVGDAPPVEAQVADHGPAPDRRWFAAAVVGEGPVESTSVVVYGGDGREIARSGF